MIVFTNATVINNNVATAAAQFLNMANNNYNIKA